MKKKLICKYCIMEKLDEWCHDHLGDKLYFLYKPICKYYDRQLLKG